jgi:glycosyltransferase involved in cell wall biosynthesis
MKILWCTWKDRKNPASGGAEVVNEEIAKRLVRDGHEVIFLVGGFTGCAPEEIVDGYKVVRLGNRWSVYWKAYRYYKKHLRGWADVVIDEVNTMPFFCKLYVKEKNILLFYQLCREIWFYQFPWFLGAIGYLLEPMYLRSLNDKFVLTESESTKSDLQKYGFKKDNILVFPVGLEYKPISEAEFLSQKKEESPTMLSLGAIRSMKRTDHIIKAFEIAKKRIKNLRLTIAGDASGRFGRKILAMIDNSPGKDAIHYLGRVNGKDKINLMKTSQLICVTSVKEGWGLIVTEANSQGTPAIVYDVDGLRDSCKNNITGVVCKKNIKDLALTMVNVLRDKELYEKYRVNAWRDSFNYDYDKTYDIILNAIKNIPKNI